MHDKSDISWHLRYYEISFLFYVGFSVIIVGFYALVYCLKMPANRIPRLEEIIDADPIITEAMMDKIGDK